MRGGRPFADRAPVDAAWAIVISGRIKIRMVECIQHIHAKLKVGLIVEKGVRQAWNREVLGNGHIELRCPGFRYTEIHHVARHGIAARPHLLNTVADQAFGEIDVTAVVDTDLRNDKTRLVISGQSVANLDRTHSNSSPLGLVPRTGEQMAYLPTSCLGANENTDREQLVLSVRT